MLFCLLSLSDILPSSTGLTLSVAAGVISFFGGRCYQLAMEAPGAQASVVTSLCGLYPCFTLILCVVAGLETLTLKKALGLLFAVLSGVFFTMK
jgi:drug/metabolite transporter (DMT)-like permease